MLFNSKSLVIILMKQIQAEKKALRDSVEAHEINYHTGVVSGLISFKEYLLGRENAARNKIQNQSQGKARRRTKKQLREDTATSSKRRSRLPGGSERDICSPGAESSTEQGIQRLPTGVKIKPDSDS